MPHSPQQPGRSYARRPKGPTFSPDRSCRFALVTVRRHVFLEHGRHTRLMRQRYLEFSGTITQVGEAVTRGWKVGDRVVVYVSGRIGVFTSFEGIY